jgi:hypothetical protein
MVIDGKKIVIPPKGLPPQEIADILGAKPVTVRCFAAKYGVTYDGEGYRKNYHFFEKDIVNFINRPKPGRRWHKEI